MLITRFTNRHLLLKPAFFTYWASIFFIWTTLWSCTNREQEVFLNRIFWYWRNRLLITKRLLFRLLLFIITATTLFLWSFINNIFFYHRKTLLWLRLKGLFFLKWFSINFFIYIWLWKFSFMLYTLLLFNFYWRFHNWWNNFWGMPFSINFNQT